MIGRVQTSMSVLPDAHLILASRSAARRAMLEAAGVTIETLSVQVDEPAIRHAARQAGWSIEATAVALAEAKAKAGLQLRPTAIVLAADQMLALDDRWIDKASSIESLRQTLSSLRGRCHRLVSAAVLWVDSGALGPPMVGTAWMAMRTFSDHFLETYLRLEGPACLGSVGGYRIEGPGAQLFARIDGDHFTIQGMPLIEVLDRLRQHGVIEA